MDVAGGLGTEYILTYSLSVHHHTAAHLNHEPENGNWHRTNYADSCESRSKDLNKQYEMHSSNSFEVSSTDIL